MSPEVTYHVIDPKDCSKTLCGFPIRQHWTREKPVKNVPSRCLNCLRQSSKLENPPSPFNY